MLIKLCIKVSKYRVRSSVLAMGKDLCQCPKCPACAAGCECQEKCGPCSSKSQASSHNYKIGGREVCRPCYDWWTKSRNQHQCPRPSDAERRLFASRLEWTEHWNEPATETPRPEEWDDEAYCILDGPYDVFRAARDECDRDDRAVPTSLEGIIGMHPAPPNPAIESILERQAARIEQLERQVYSMTCTFDHMAAHFDQVVYQVDRLEYIVDSHGLRPRTSTSSTHGDNVPAPENPNDA